MARAALVLTVSDGVAAATRDDASGEMPGLGAFMATVQVYREQDVVAHLWRYGGRLLRGMQDIARSRGLERPRLAFARGQWPRHSDHQRETQHPDPRGRPDPFGRPDPRVRSAPC